MPEITAKDVAEGILSKFEADRQQVHANSQLKELGRQLDWGVGNGSATKTYRVLHTRGQSTLNVKVVVDISDPATPFEFRVEELGISKRFATIIDVLNFIYEYQNALDGNDIRF